MRKLARVAGIVWMVMCFAAWLALGIWEPLGRIDNRQYSWGVLTLLSDNQFGLSFVAIILGGLGYLLWQWGKGAPACGLDAD